MCIDEDDAVGGTVRISIDLGSETTYVSPPFPRIRRFLRKMAGTLWWCVAWHLRARALTTSALRRAKKRARPPCVGCLDRHGFPSDGATERLIESIHTYSCDQTQPHQ